MVRRRPEGDQEPEHDRVAHEVVEPARDERHLGVGARRARAATTWRSPNRSKWLIMKVDSRTMSQPSGEQRPQGDAADRVGRPPRPPPAIGRHCQKSSDQRKARQAGRRCCARPACGTKRVHQRLKPGRAITLCCTANRPSSSTFTRIDSISPAGAPESMVLGTGKLPTKADGVEEDDEKDEVADGAVKESECAHGNDPPLAARCVPERTHSVAWDAGPGCAARGLKG